MHAVIQACAVRIPEQYLKKDILLYLFYLFMDIWIACDSLFSGIKIGMPCGIPILYPSGTGKASGHRGNLNDASYLLSINTRYTAPISSTNARI